MRGGEGEERRKRGEEKRREKEKECQSAKDFQVIMG